MESLVGQILKTDEQAELYQPLVADKWMLRGYQMMSGFRASKLGVENSELKTGMARPPRRMEIKNHGPTIMRIARIRARIERKPRAPVVVWRDLKGWADDKIIRETFFNLWDENLG